jgi:hypothetical protein
MALVVRNRVALARPSGAGLQYAVIPVRPGFFATVIAVAGANVDLLFDTGVPVSTVPDAGLDLITPIVGVEPRMVQPLRFTSGTDDKRLPSAYAGIIVGAYSRILNGSGENKGDFYLIRMVGARGTEYFEGLASDFETLPGR